MQRLHVIIVLKPIRFGYNRRFTKKNARIGMNNHRHPRLGVALGGGGSRAFVHLGVLAGLAEGGLRPHCLSGSSMGAVLGALYAAEPDPENALPRILDYFRKSSLFGRLARHHKGDGLHRRRGWLGGLVRKFATASVASAISFRRGLRKMNPVNRAIDDFFTKDSRCFTDLALPFGSNALNLTTGELEEFTTGPISPALKAGVAIGLIFAPYVWDDRQYADAAPICPVPAGLCRRLGAEVVLAVDICAPLLSPHESQCGFDVVQRIMSVQSELLNRRETGGADLVMRLDVSDVFWADFSRIDELVARGRKAAAEAIPGLRDRMATWPGPENEDAKR